MPEQSLKRNSKAMEHRYAETLIQDIEKIVKGSYDRWRIGMTRNLKRARQQHEQPITWFDWAVSDTRKSCDVIRHFAQKGMESAQADKEQGKYIYIF